MRGVHCDADGSGGEPKMYTTRRQSKWGGGRGKRSIRQGSREKRDGQGSKNELLLNRIYRSLQLDNSKNSSV
jgi:hypothetical protein